MIDTCDSCGQPRGEEWHLVRTPRPSDPTDMCCVIAGCSNCFPYSEGTCMTEEQWEVWIETEGPAQGRYFLT